MHGPASREPWYDSHTHALALVATQLVRNHMDRIGRAVPLIAKMERPQALSNLDELLAEADGMSTCRPVPFQRALSRSRVPSPSRSLADSLMGD